MDVDALVVLKLAHQFLRLLERLLKRVGIRPCEVGRIIRLVEVIEGVGELDPEVLVFAPVEGSRAALPFHRVRTDSINRSQPHFVELPLCRHPLDIESQRLPRSNAFHAKIEPRVEVAL